MFNTRLRSSIILVILTVLVLYIGGPFSAFVIGLVSLKGIQELLRVYALDKSRFAWAAYITTILYYLLLVLDKKDLIMPLIILYLLVVLALYVFAFPKFKDGAVMQTFLSFFYVSVMLSYVYQIRDITPHGLVYVILIYVSSWGNDTCAYLVGRKIGKHKMAPELSPNKSVEGAIAGILGSGVFGAVFGVIFCRFILDGTMQIPIILIFAVIGALGAFPAIIGDLAASAIKRNNDIKDYGNLIPGHGGILDRFDSIIFTAPIVYYLIMFMSRFGL